MGIALRYAELQCLKNSKNWRSINLTLGKIIRGQKSEFMSKNLTSVIYFSTIFIEQNSKTICYKCTNFIVLMDFYFKN